MSLIVSVSLLTKIDGLVTKKPRLLAPTLSNTLGAIAPTATILARDLVCTWPVVKIRFNIDWERRIDLVGSVDSKFLVRLNSKPSIEFFVIRISGIKL